VGQPGDLVKLVPGLRRAGPVVAGEGLEVLVCAGRDLGYLIMHLIGDPTPLLLLRHEESPDQVLKSPLTLGKLPVQTRVIDGGCCAVRQFL
jgi:hypothetical protein